MNGKQGILKAINKVKGLDHDKQYPFKITFSRFMDPKQIKWIMNRPWSSEHEPDWMAESMMEQFGIVTAANIDVESIPTCNTIDEATSWWNSIEKMTSLN